MTDTVDTVILHIRTLRKCGISTVFAPGILNSDADKRLWCLKAVALLAGHDLQEFDETVLPLLRANAEWDLWVLIESDRVTKEDRARFEPLLRTAKALYEIVQGQSVELDQKLITACPAN